jgi:hypothetical protein
MYQQHHHQAPGGDGGSNINVPDRRVKGPVRTIVVIGAMFLSASGAEDFSHGYVVFNAWLAGSAIALTIIVTVVSAIRRPYLIRQAEERARAEIGSAYTGVVERKDTLVGVTTPNVVGGYDLVIRCEDGVLVKVRLPYIRGCVGFEAGSLVVKRAGERWPADAGRGPAAHPA